MVGDLMALGDDPLDDLGVSRRSLAHNEERGSCVVLGEGVEDRRREARVGSIIEGKCYRPPRSGHRTSRTVRERRSIQE
jgi:hypothetical protein